MPAAILCKAGRPVFGTREGISDDNMELLRNIGYDVKIHCGLRCKRGRSCQIPEYQEDMNWHEILQLMVEVADEAKRMLLS